MKHSKHQTSKEISKANFEGYWTFYHKPENDEPWTNDVLLNPDLESWDYLVQSNTAQLLAPGQLGVIRTGVDSRRKDKRDGKEILSEGVHAIVEVTEQVSSLSGEDRVKLRFLKRLTRDKISLELLRNDPRITDTKIIQFNNGWKSQPLNEESFIRVLELADSSQLLSAYEFPVVNNLDELLALQDKFKNASPKVKSRVSKSIERGNIGERVKKFHGYRCQICNELGLESLGFQKRSGGHFVEAHHVVYVSKGQEGSLAPANIISVCANHHRQIHYGICALDENKSCNKYFVYVLEDKEIKVSKAGS